MASATSLTTLEDEVNCPICQSILREPVTIDCGHNFCRGCLTRYCEIPAPDPGEQPTCPLCKDPFHPEGLRPNWQLASVVENIERLKLAPPGLGEGLCEEHEEKIYFFCEDDEKQLCVKCRETLEHRTHTVRFLEDAADPYREQIHRCLESLKNEREDIQGIQFREDQRIQVLLTQVATKKEKVILEFEHMCRFLERQQCLLLTQLEELGGDILKQKNEFESLVQSEICRFNALISELEEKLERPARELLKDIRSTLIRCETRKCRKPEAVSPELGERIRDFPQQALQLQREMKIFLEKLLFELDYEPAHIFLDPQTSHPKLLLSEDHQRAQFSYKWQTSPDSPQRFDRAICVLAQAGFVGGRHTWVVAVDLAHGGSCTMGVVNQDVRRKGELRLRPEEGIWAVRLAWGFVSALGSFPTRLSLEENPKQIRISLDYEVGWVTFSNATTQEPIYTFTASFTGRIFPFFGLWGRGSSFSLSP
ncbi:tripartite motif-containing protein 10-like [Dromiciops gliroides]|uniref:tripartite motif-containing protein 10-like n=1 Tax=Dromiciops gliroides TaxID=33562 RepID=UPI001CC5AF7F|nr:tripartite motif-containing protein 10-like [Dromiciops gliroides]XP_043858429.1 tripartite motif-containing protein 10-like [Dromiciops gliroides]